MAREAVELPVESREQKSTVEKAREQQRTSITASVNHENGEDSGDGETSVTNDGEEHAGSIWR